jgi:hypothetical protein
MNLPNDDDIQIDLRDLVRHPTVISPEKKAKEQFQILVQQGLQTLVGLAVRANEVTEDLDVVFSRCHHIQKENACATTCPMWDGEQCLGKKWREIFEDDYGWTEDVRDMLFGALQQKAETQGTEDAEFKEVDIDDSGN